MIQFTNTHDFLPFLNTWENVIKFQCMETFKSPNTRINEYSKQIWTIYKGNRHVIKFDQPVPMAFNSLYCETSPNSCGSSGLFGWLGIPELCFLMSLPNPLLLYHHRRFLFVYVQQYDVTKGQKNVLSLGFEEMFTAHCPPSNWGSESELKLGYRKLSSSQLPVCLLPEWMGGGWWGSYRAYSNAWCVGSDRYSSGAARPRNFLSIGYLAVGSGVKCHVEYSRLRDFTNFWGI